MTEINQEIAAALWPLLGVTVTTDNSRIQPIQHRGNVIFIGYADIHLWLFDPQGVAIPLTTLCGNSIKLINNEIHFDPKSERGKGTRSKDFFPHWRPSGPESRAVLTRKLAEDPTITEMVAIALAKLKAADLAAQA